jgi:hypothetical protein
VDNGVTFQELWKQNIDVDRKAAGLGSTNHPDSKPTYRDLGVVSQALVDRRFPPRMQLQAFAFRDNDQSGSHMHALFRTAWVTPHN